jgi:very-short-patch-repair endonuclease
VWDRRAVARHPLVPPELTRGPFTIEQAARAGLTRWQLQGKSWRSLERDLYMWSGLEDSPMLRLAAARLRLPEAAVFCGRTAAWLHGLDVPPCAPIEAILPPERWPSHRGSLATRRARWRPDEVVSRHGFPTTSIARTLLDLSRSWSLTEAVVIVDCALRIGLVKKAELCGAARTGMRGVRKFRQVIDLAELKAESQMESRLRILLVLGGLPRPQVQVDLHDASGVWLARVDLYYPSHRLAIEYDGGTHRTSLVQDDRRQNHLLKANYKLLRYTAPDVLRTPELTVAQVRGVLLS